MLYYSVSITLHYPLGIANYETRAANSFQFTATLETFKVTIINNVTTISLLKP